MEKNQLIGFLLIMGLILAMSIVNAPSKEEIAEQQRIKDSIAQAEELVDQQATETVARATIDTSTVNQDSLDRVDRRNSFGSFAQAATGKEQTSSLESDVLRLEFSNKGGRISQVELKQFHRLVENPGADDLQEPLVLLENDKNRWEYLLQNEGRSIRTGDLYFTPKISGNQISYTADLGQGRQIVQTYTVNDGSYVIDYDVNFKNMDGNLDGDQVKFYWENHLKPIEKNDRYERTMYSAFYYRDSKEDVDDTGMRRGKLKDLENERLDWISSGQQFFNTTVIPDEPFYGKTVETIIGEEDSDLLKTFRSTMGVPVGRGSDQGLSMKIYSGPNDFEILKDMNMDIEQVVPFGWGIFGTINRWIVRPLFNLLLGLFSSKGLVIIILTLIVKAILYPLTYKMLHSQAKMSALKPQLAGLKEKYDGDQQKVQMETMKIYREYGVNPLGGCLPMVAQMPIWIALYRFFPASIEFRQSSFLWANDLSSYDAFFQLPFEMPFGMGSHLSLFTLLWAVTTVIYTYYNTRHMDMSINPAMKWMQYLMPIMFLGFFNSYASGLTCYLLFSNIFNITQTIGTKKLVFNDDKIMAELNKKKAKPKKKGGFQERLQKALAEQQKIAAEREKSRKK